MPYSPTMKREDNAYSAEKIIVGLLLFASKEAKLIKRVRRKRIYQPQMRKSVRPGQQIG